MKIINDGFDHIVFTVQDLRQHVDLWERMGFSQVGKRELPKRSLSSVLMQQGRARVVINQFDGDVAGEPDYDFLKTHGDGTSVMALAVDDARAFFQETVKRGALPALEPQVFESSQGSVVKAEVYTPSDLRFSFIERKSSSNTKDPALFDEGLVAETMESDAPFGIQAIDHLTNNVRMGDTKTWVDYYEKIFGFRSTRHFDITTGKTGLISDVIEDPERKIKVPINEATEPESQVQEFCERFKGVGVQHIAFETRDIYGCVGGLRDRGFEFLFVPATYYEMVPGRGFAYDENMSELEDKQIMIDGDDSGYLLQIFTNELVGPAFFEYIQRKGNQGFGEGNFQALFEAIERDQVRRGVLPA